MAIGALLEAQNHRKTQGIIRFMAIGAPWAPIYINKLPINRKAATSKYKGFCDLGSSKAPKT